MCELCPKDEAEFFCSDCQREMCGTCKTKHMKIKTSNNHNVVSIVLHKRDKKLLKCTTHPDEEIQMYCRNCDVPVCLTCIADDNHKTHSFDKLETIVSKCKGEMSKTIHETEQQILKLEKSLNNVEINIKDYTKTSNGIIDEINKKREFVKSEVDNIADDLVVQVEKQKTRDLKIMEKQKGNIRKIISEQKEYLLSCKQKFKSMHKFSDIQIQEKQSKMFYQPTATHIYPPKFVSDGTLNLQDMFGNIVSFLEISTEVISVIKPDRVYNVVCAVNNEEAWCGVGDELVLIDIHGNVQRKIKLDCDLFNIAVTTTGDLLVTESDGTCIKKYLSDDNGIIITDTQPYKTHGIWVVPQGDILVCLFNTPDDNKVVRMNATGDIKQTIQNDEEEKPLFKYPLYVTENINGDICVVDDHHPATIVVVDEKGKLRYRYPDPVETSLFINDCDGIVCDNAGFILVCDQNNHRIHQVDIDGSFIQFILTKQHDLEYPLYISIDNKCQIWLLNKEGDEVIVFKYKAFT